MNPCCKRTCAALALALTIAALPADAVDAAAGLGRLFFTPAQRLDLDKRRLADTQEVTISLDNFVTVNGQVSRSSGKTTTWINRTPHHAHSHSGDPASVLVPTGEDRPPMPLKIGETYDKVRGDKRDVLGDGQVRVPASKR